MSQPPTVGILGAYGATGSVVAEELTKHGDYGILVAGRDAGKSAELAARLGRRIRSQTVDVFNETQLDAFCRECGIVVNCTGPSFKVLDRVAQAAMAQDCHYVDPGGSEPLYKLLAPHQDELRKRQLCFLVSAGWITGLSEVFTMYVDHVASQNLGTIRRLELHYGDVNPWSETGTLDQIQYMEDYAYSAIGFYAGGEWQPRSVLRCSRFVHLPDPIGKQLAFLHFFPELVAFSKRKKYDEIRSYVSLMSVRTMFTMNYIRFFLKRSPKKASMVLRRAIRRDKQICGCPGFLYVRVSDGAGREVRAKLFERGHYWTTGIVPATAVRLLANRQMTNYGCHYLGDGVDPVIFMDKLKSAGVQYEIERPPQGDIDEQH